MPPPSALSKMAPNFKSIKADLYNIEDTTEGPCKLKRLTYIL